MDAIVGRFAKLSFAQKIIVLPVIALVALVAVVGITTQLNRSNRERLTSIRDGYYPSVQGSRSLQEILVALQRSHQDAVQEGNGLRLRVYGEAGSLDWRQEDPNRLHLKWLDAPEEIRHASGSYLGDSARVVTRLPGGHPEGYLEAFAVLYREFADGLVAWKDGQADPLPETLPGIIAGVRGMRFIDRAIESNRRKSWIEF